MWLEDSNSSHVEPSTRRWTSSTMRGVASSCRPEISSVGVAISPRRSVMSQSLSEPVTWNSLGPIIVP